MNDAELHDLLDAAASSFAPEPDPGRLESALRSGRRGRGIVYGLGFAAALAVAVGGAAAMTGEDSADRMVPSDDAPVPTEVREYVEIDVDELLPIATVHPTTTEPSPPSTTQPPTPSTTAEPAGAVPSDPPEFEPPPLAPSPVAPPTSDLAPAPEPPPTSDLAPAPATTHPPAPATTHPPAPATTHPPATTDPPPPPPTTAPAPTAPPTTHPPTTTSPAVGFSARQTWGTCGEDPPYEELSGTAAPGTAINVSSPYGSGSTTAGGDGTWYVKVYFPSAPPYESFTIQVDSAQGSASFPFLHTP